MMNTPYEHYDTRRINAIPITGVAQRLGYELKRAGSVWKIQCPWHEDRHPSLTLYERTNENRCHCFACGKGGSVIDLTMQHSGWTFQEACRWLCNEFCIPTTQEHGHVPLPVPKRVEKPAEPTYTYIPQEMLAGLVSVDNSLCQCLMRMFTPAAVESVAGEYLLGTYNYRDIDEYTVFPNIDARGRVCNLKIQHYDTEPSSLRFAHSDAGCLWLGSLWAKEGRLAKDAEFRSDCLFGEHLLPRYPMQKVALVESPKNAIFGALAFPRMLWVATGNKGALKRRVLQPLQGRDVLVIPDRDAIQAWTETIATMRDLANFVISDFCERQAPSCAEKFDIADYIQQLRQPMPF